MKTFSSFNKYIEKSIINNWNQDALTDYKGITLQYHDVARKIEKLHILLNIPEEKRAIRLPFADETPPIGRWRFSQP